MSKQQKPLDKKGLSTKPVFTEEVGKPRGPAVSLDSGVYTLMHMGITKGDYEALVLPRKQGKFDGKVPDLRIVEITDGITADDLLPRIARVGELYGWGRRQEFQEENRPVLDNLLEQDSSRLFIFEKKDDDDRWIDIGLCFVTGFEGTETLDLDELEDEGLKRKLNALKEFKSTKRLPADSQPVEINKIGLYDEYTDNGYGSYFLTKMLHTLLQGKNSSDFVYLNTRDTNHAGVPSFYAKNDVHKFLTEANLTSDLVEEQPSHDPAPGYEDRGQPVNGDKNKAAVTAADVDAKAPTDEQDAVAPDELQISHSTTVEQQSGYNIDDVPGGGVDAPK